MLNYCRVSLSISSSFSVILLIFIYMYTPGGREWSVLSRIKAWTPSQGSTPRPLDMGVQHVEHWATSALFWVSLEWQSYLLFPCLDLDISSMLCTTQKKDCKHVYLHIIFNFLKTTRRFSLQLNRGLNEVYKITSRLQYITVKFEFPEKILKATIHV